MNTILEQINSTGLTFVEFALPMLIQSSMLILILLLVDLVLRKRVRAVFRYCVWMLVLVKLVLPVSLSSPLSLGYWFGDKLVSIDIARTTVEAEKQQETVKPAPAIMPQIIDLSNIQASTHTPAVAPTTADAEPIVAEPVNPPVISATPVTWQAVVFLVWLAGVTAMGLLLLQRAIFVRGLVAQAKYAQGVMNDSLEYCRTRMGVRRKVGLKVSANATSPAVCGLFRRVILVPQNLTSSLGSGQLQTVLLHELAHIKRGDLWVNLAQTILQIIYFYNPMLWLANSIIRRVREQAVDEMVLVAMGEKAQQYPQTLVNVAKLAFKRPALSLRLIGVVESKSALAGRIKHILNRPMPKKAKLGILGLAVVIIAAAILLPMATCKPGPPSLVIKGVVKDAQTGEPIAGARVFDDGYGPKPSWEQIKANERSEWGAITNSAGEYSFLTWPEHHLLFFYLSIKVEALGYRAKRESLYDGHFTFNKKDEEIFDFALEPEEVSESSGFKKTLPNGVTVELVGICEHPSEGKQWWRPDGSKLLNRPYDKVGGHVYPNANEQAREFAVRVTSPNSKDWGYSWQIQPGGSSTSGSVPVKNGKKQEDLRYIAISMPSKYEVAKVSFAVASGPWHTLDSRAADGKGVASSSGEGGGIIWLSPHCNENETVLSVCHTYKEPQVRIVAIGKNGDLHTGSYTCDAVGEMATITATFDLLLSNIEEFQFQTRPYRMVRFEDVSLIPGNITDVKTTVSRPDTQAKFPDKTDMLSEIEGTRISTSGGKVSVVKGERGPDVTIRRKLPPEGTAYFKKFDQEYLLEMVSKSYGQDIRELVGRKSTGGGSGPNYIQKRIGFGIPFAHKGIDGFRKMRDFQKQLREDITKDIKDTLGVRALGSMASDFGHLIYSTDKVVGSINIYFSQTDEDILQIKFVIQEVVTDSGKTDVQIEVGKPDSTEAVTKQGRKVYLPDLETRGAKVVLDLATGEMLSAEGMEKDRQHFDKIGKGDIVYEYASGKGSLLCLRGAKMQLRTYEGLVVSLKPNIQRKYFVGYFLEDVPCQYQVTTAEGYRYELKVLSVDKGDTGGAHIEYWKTDVQAEVGKNRVGPATKPETKSTSIQKKQSIKVIRGFVKDKAAQAIPKAKLVLYYNRSRWGLGNRIAEETESAADGSFTFKNPLTYSSAAKYPYGRDSYIILATHPDYALGWHNITRGQEKASYELILTEPKSQTITVTDLAGNPLPGARVWPYSLGNRESSEPLFREYLSLPTDAGVVSGTTGPDGKAVITNLPRTSCSFHATLKGYATGLSFDGEKPIRLTKGATVSGSVLNEEGKPVEGALVKFFTNWRGQYFLAQTDSQGRFCLEDLPAEGWDMSPRVRSEGADGSYKITIQHADYTAPETQAQLEPGDVIENFIIDAYRGTLVKCRVVEVDTDRTIAGARIYGSNESGRIDGHSDPNGLFTVRVMPGRTSLLFQSPPEGVYIDGPMTVTRKDLPESHLQFDAQGDEMTVTLKTPRIAGRLTSVQGIVFDPDGKSSSKAVVHASADQFLTAKRGYVPPAGVNNDGRFELKEVPAGRKLCLYAVTNDGRLAGTAVFDIPAEPDRSPFAEIKLQATKTVSITIKDNAGEPVRNAALRLRPMVEGQRIPLAERTARTDEQGLLEIDGILPGLQYYLQDTSMGRQGRISRADVERQFEATLTLIPIEPNLSQQAESRGDEQHKYFSATQPARKPDVQVEDTKIETDSSGEAVNSGELTGRVVDENGNNVADAQVALSTEKIGVLVADGKLQPIRSDVESRIVQTDSQGVFDLGQMPDEDFDLIVAHEKGFSLVESGEFVEPGEIHLQPWCCIEGQLAEGRKATENKIWMSSLPNLTWFKHKREYRYETKCDERGHFVFDKVPPGWFEVGYLTRTGENSWSLTSRTPVVLKLGQTTKMRLGGEGRPVTGRFVPPQGYDMPIYFGNGLRSLATQRPERPRPDNYDRMTKRQQQQWYKEWYKTDEYRKFQDAYWHNKNWRQYAFSINKDGSFRIEDVIAGKYQFTVWIEERLTGQGRPEEIAGYYGTIEVPEIPGGRSDEPLDLGELELTMHNPLRVGDIAPLFEAKTLDGKDLKLIDYRGKFVLLSFWQPVFHPEKQQLQELYDTYGGNRQLEIIGLGGNDTLEEVKNYVEENAIPWPQIYTGEEFKSGIAKDYGGFGIFLIDPEGRIIAKDLRGDKLKSVVSEAIKVANVNKPDVQVEDETAKAGKTDAGMGQAEAIEKVSSFIASDLPASVQDVKFFYNSIFGTHQVLIRFDIAPEDLKNLMKNSDKLPDFPDLHKNPKIHTGMVETHKVLKIDWWKPGELESPICAGWQKSKRAMGDPRVWFYSLLKICCSREDNNLIRVYIDFFSEPDDLPFSNPDMKREIEEPKVWSQKLAGDVFAAIIAHDNNSLEALNIDSGLLSALGGYRREYDFSGLNRMVHYQKADRCFVIVSPIRHKEGKYPDQEIRFGFKLKQGIWVAGLLENGNIGAKDDILKREGFEEFSRIDLTRKITDRTPINPANNSAVQIESKIEQSSPVRKKVTDIDLPFTFTIYTLTPDVKPQPGVKIRCVHPRPERAEPIVDMIAGSVSVVKPSWRVYAMLVWLLGALALATWLIIRFRQLRGPHRGRQDVAGLPPWFGKLLADTAKKLNLRRLPEVAFSETVVCPSVFGIFRPVLLLPKKDMTGFSPKDTEHVLSHELAHIKRGDLWVHGIYMVLQIVYWFNPLLWFVRRQLQHLRELCCDATVARILREKTTDYRQTILETARRLLARPVEPGIGLLGLFEDSSRLVVRLRWLEKKTWKHRGLRIATCCAAIAVMTACILPMARAKTKEKTSVQSEETTQINPNSEQGGEKKYTVRGFVTDKLGRPRGNVYITTSLNIRRDAIKTDERGQFTLEVIQPEQKNWVAYSQPSQAMGLFTIPEEYAGQAIHVVLDFREAQAEGRIVGPDGKGLANRAVELIINTKQGVSCYSPRYRKTDQYGNYSLRIPCGSSLTVQAKLADANDSEQKYVTEAIALSDNQIFVPMPTLVIGEGQPEQTDDGKVLYSGRVLNQENQPIPGVKVTLTFRMPGWMSIWVESVMTDETGRWQRRLPRDLSNVSIHLLHPQYVKQSWQKVSSAELLNGTNVMVMKRGLRLKGVVKNQQGEPIENALVDTGGGEGTTVYGEVIENCTTPRTLADGSFSVGGLPAGSKDIVVSAVGYAPRVISVEIEAGMEPIEVSLKSGRAYLGRVVDIDGNPVEGVKIDVGYWRVGKRRSSITRITKTDSQGLFKIENLPEEGKLRFNFGKRDSGLLGFGKEIPEDLSHRDKIVMYKTPVFIGKVVDAETEEPITSFEVINGVKWKSVDESPHWSRYRKRQVNSEDGTFTQTWAGYHITYPFDGASCLKIEAKGYLPEIAPPIKLGQKYEPFVVRLTKAQPWKGIVVDHEGKPAVKAEVGWVGPGKKAFLNDGKFDMRGFVYQAEAIVETDSNGHFELNPTTEQGLIVVVAADGYAYVKSAEFANASEIRLTPWAKIEGNIVSSSDEKREAVAITVNLIDPSENKESQPIYWLFDRFSVSNRHFAIDHIPSIPLHVGQVIRWEQSNPVYIKPQPGQTYQIQIGGRGRTITGKIIHPIPERARETGEEGMSNPRRLHAVAYCIEPESKLPDEIKNVSQDSFLWLWHDAKNAYERSKTYQERFIPNVKDDGTFEFENMPPGKYEFVVNYHAPLGENVSCGRGVLEATAITPFVVEDDRSNRPISLPDISMKLLTYPKVGEPAPLFEAESFDSKTINLGDLHGKVVLLDFWATWCAPCIGQIPKLKEVYDSFSPNPRFVMIGMSVDSDIEKAKKFVVQKELKWPQVCLGSMDESLVVKQYGVGSIPTTILISPDGKILARNLSAEQLKLAISKALGL